MQVIRNVSFEMVLAAFTEENRKTETNQGNNAFNWTVNELKKSQAELPDQWKLVTLCKSDILGIMIRGGHEHSIHGAGPLIRRDETISIAGAAERLRSLDKAKIPECWDNICYQKSRDISQTHLFLRAADDLLWHIDGLHRMLAWVLFKGEGTVPVFVVG